MAQTNNIPTTEQLNSLNSFAKANGRRWKSKLRDLWQTGNWRGVAGSGHLQQIRNQLGFQFLDKFVATHSI